MVKDELPQPTLDALGALTDRFQLPGPAQAALGGYIKLLAFDPLAPTAVREPARILDDHLADSLVALDLEGVRSATRAADLGSGAGLPGIPLALALPSVRFALLESNHRKAAFLSRAVGACGLANVSVVPERAEAWPPGLGSCDLVTVRAVAELDVVAEYAAPLLRAGGWLVAWRGKRDVQGEARGARAAEILGLRCHDPVPVRPFPGALHRHLYVMSKVSDTPDRFPRRPGIAEKRPLGLRA